MPVTYKLLGSNTLSNTTTSITFSGIPATYTDLIVEYTSRSATNNVDFYVQANYNGNTQTIYSNNRFFTNGSTTSAAGNFSSTWTWGGTNTGANATTNIFGNNEIYICSYALTGSGSQKIGYADGTTENVGSSIQRVYAANLWQNTGSAISSITLTDPSNSGWVAGSSFFLYGIKNS